MDTDSLNLLCDIVSANGGTPHIASSSDWKKGFLVRYEDLTPEAKKRYTDYIGADVDDDFEVAADLTRYIHDGIVTEEMKVR